MTEEKRPRPDWSQWSNMGQALLLEAVLLSMDIDPCIATRSDFERRLQDYRLLDKVRSRAAIARSHLDKSLPFSGWHQDDGPSVNLVTFREWGESLPVPFKFPKQYPGAKTLGLKQKEPEASPPNATVSVRRVNAGDGRGVGTLAKVIDVAAGAVGGLAAENASIWVALMILADADDPPSPLRGRVAGNKEVGKKGGVKYLATSGSEEILKYANFCDRLRRLREKAGSSR